MRRFSTKAVVVLLILSILVIPSMAALMWNVTFNVTTSHGYNDSTHEAAVYVSITPYYSNTIYNINVYLERYSGSTWVPVASWTGLSSSTNDFSFYDTTSNVKKYLTYRVHVTGTVSSNGITDNLNVIGTTQVY